MHNCRLLCNRIYPLQWIISPSVESWHEKSSPLHEYSRDTLAGSTHVYRNMTSVIWGGHDGGFSVEGETFVICVNTQIMSGIRSWLPLCRRCIYIFSLILTAQHNGFKKRGCFSVCSMYIVQPTALIWLWSTCSYCRWCWYSRWSQHSAAGQGESKWFILLHLAADLVFSVSVMFRLHFSDCIKSTTLQRKDDYGGETVRLEERVGGQDGGFLSHQQPTLCLVWFSSNNLYEGPSTKCYKSFIRCLSILIRPTYL